MGVAVDDETDIDDADVFREIRVDFFFHCAGSFKTGFFGLFRSARFTSSASFRDGGSDLACFLGCFCLFGNTFVSRSVTFESSILAGVCVSSVSVDEQLVRQERNGCGLIYQTKETKKSNI